MRCPHCHLEIPDKQHVFALGEDPDGTWQVASSRCPACDRLIVSLCTTEGCTYPAWPVASARPRLSDDVPPEYATEYHTACQLLTYSLEASAAVSRRLLGRFLAEQTVAGEGPLDEQIRLVSGLHGLPPYLKSALQTLARLANLAADSAKTRSPQMLTPVEPGEAEWILDVLEQLFEFHFVQPARLRRKQAALEEKVGILGAPAPDKAVSSAPEPSPQADRPVSDPSDT